MNDALALELQDLREQIDALDRLVMTMLAILIPETVDPESTLNQLRAQIKALDLDTGSDEPSHARLSQLLRLLDHHATLRWQERKPPA